MSFDSILGQDTAVQTLRRALASGRAHHAYRFEGPAGVGKERAAFAFAQALVCSAGAPLGCGECSACERAVRLSEDEPRVPAHPDVVLVERGLYPPSVLGRTSPESAGIGVEQVRRVVLARAAYPPHEAAHLTFIFRAAHELTASAANALLKTLEEPRPGVHFVLLTDQPRRLLDTIRSRTLPVRFGPLPDRAVAEILARHGKAAPPDVLALAAGSAEKALSLSDPEAAKQRDAFLDAVRQAVRARDLGTAVEFAAAAHYAKADLTRDLQALAQYFTAAARQQAASEPDQALRSARRHAAVQAATDALERNSPPALAVEALLARLRRC